MPNMPSSSVSKFPTGRPRRIKTRDRESLHRVEQIGSANPPLAVHCLHDDRRRQFRLYGTSESSQLDSLFAIASSLLNVAHRSLHVRVAVCRQVARAPNRPIGTNTMVIKARKNVGSTRKHPRSIYRCENWRAMG